MGQKKIAILGAGISGLWAADALLKINPNLKITVLEKQNSSGGLFNSSDRCGFHLNHGLFLFPPDSPLVKMMPHRFSPIHVSYNKFLHDDLMRFPVDPEEMRTIWKMSETIPFLHHKLTRTINILTGKRPTNLDEWLELNLPETWNEIFRINDYVYKLMGFEPSELSQDVGQQRLEYIIRMLRPINMAKHLRRRLRLMMPGKAKRLPPSIVQHRWLNHEGTGGFIKELAENVKSSGARIQTGVTIQSIQSHDSSYRVEIESMDPMEFDLVLSTIPLVELAAYRTHQPLSSQYLKWRNLTLFYFRLKQKLKQKDEPWVIYSFDRNQCWKRAVIRQMTEDTCAVRVEITEHHSLHGQHEVLMKKIKSDLNEILGVTDQDHWEDWEAMEVPYGYPCLLEGYREEMSEINNQILEPGIYSLGRQGKHRYATSSICANMVEKDIQKITARHNLGNI